MILERFRNILTAAKKGIELQSAAERGRALSNSDSQFWSACDLTLEEIVELMRQPFGLLEPELDAENVFEWVEVSTECGLEFNISRKHTEPIDEHTNPTRFVIRGIISDVEDMGLALAYCLNCDFLLGTVQYQRGNEFEFQPTRRFKAAEAASRIEELTFKNTAEQFVDDNPS